MGMPGKEYQMSKEFFREFYERKELQRFAEAWAIKFGH
jgi:hypothetical protein